MIDRLRARLLLAGSATDELALIREIENVGGGVVADALCYTSPAAGTGTSHIVREV